MSNVIYLPRRFQFARLKNDHFWNSIKCLKQKRPSGFLAHLLIDLCSIRKCNKTAINYRAFFARRPQSDLTFCHIFISVKFGPTTGMLDANIFSSNCISNIIICLVFEINIIYHDMLSTVGMTACQKCLEKTFGSSRWHFGILTATLGLLVQRFWWNILKEHPKISQTANF
jgi:hypothetical protein